MPLNGPSACAIRKLWKDDYSGLEVETWGDGTAKTYTNAASCALCGKMFADATMDFDIGNEMALQVEALISRTRSFDMSGNEKEWSISNQILERLAGRLGFDPINYGAEAMSYLTWDKENKSAHGWTKELFESVAMFLALVNKGNTRITMKDVCEKHKYELIRDLPKPPRMDWGDVDPVRANRLLRDLVKNGIVEYKPVRDIETIIRNSDVVKQKFDESMVQRALELAESNKSISRSKNVAAAPCTLRSRRQSQAQRSLKNRFQRTSMLQKEAYATQSRSRKNQFWVLLEEIRQRKRAECQDLLLGCYVTSGKNSVTTSFLDYVVNFLKVVQTIRVPFRFPALEADFKVRTSTNGSSSDVLRSYSSQISPILTYFSGMCLQNVNVTFVLSVDLRCVFVFSNKFGFDVKVPTSLFAPTPTLWAISLKAISGLSDSWNTFSFFSRLLIWPSSPLVITPHQRFQRFLIQAIRLAFDPEHRQMFRTFCPLRSLFPNSQGRFGHS